MNSQTSAQKDELHLLAPESTGEKPVNFDDLASLYKAVGDPLRLEILRVLANQSYGVLELSTIFDTKQSGMSHHLKVLANAGLVATRREGNSIFYRQALPGNDTQGQIRQQIYNALKDTALTAAVAERQTHVQADRTKASQLFFSDNATKFRQQQDLIASYPVYAEQVTELLLATPFPAQKLALELGPGEGEFLSQLSKKFHQVIALDNSAQMLDKARSTAVNEQLTNIAFELGDSTQLHEQLHNIDCIVANMVLHHTPAPADIIQHLSQAMKPGAALLVTDLCLHDQVWAREACGDIWLGFDPEDLTAWAANAGLVDGQSVFFALRNGFQIQIRQFFKPSL